MPLLAVFVYIYSTMKLLAQLFFWLIGWKTAGTVPPMDKYVAIVAPHTSVYDAVYGLMAKYIFGIKFSFLGKQEAFRFPMGILLKAFGGIPVDRSISHNLVQEVVNMFNTRTHFVLALSPEGTRQRVDKWRTGFYYIALQAKVPIVLCYLNYETKTAGLGPVFYPTGDIEADIEEIKKFYRPIKGLHPQQGVF